MPRKKVTTSENSPVQPGTKRVTVQEVYEEPIEETVDIDATEVEGYEPDPVEDFINRIEQERQLDMFVYALPNYFQDGRTAIRGTLRLFVTRFPFGPDDIATFEQRIQLAYPQGGMFDLELRDNGKPVKKFTRAVAPLPGHQASTPGQQMPSGPGYPIIVNPPAQPAGQQQRQPDPREMLRDQMSFVKDMIQIAKEMAPTPAAPTQPTDIATDPRFVEVQTRVAVMDRLIGLAGNNAPLAERLLGKFLNDDAPSETGPSWIQLGIELLKNAPTIIESIARYAPAMTTMRNGTGGYAQQGTTGVASAAALPPAPNQQGQQQQQQEPPPPVDPLTQRWQQVMRRLVEDCASAASIDNSVNSVLELYETAPLTRPTIDQLTIAPPVEVITLCAASSTTREQFSYVMGLAQYPAPLQWIGELQAALKEDLDKLKVELEQQEQQGQQEQGDDDNE